MILLLVIATLSVALNTVLLVDRHKRKKNEDDQERVISEYSYEMSELMYKLKKLEAENNEKAEQIFLIKALSTKVPENKKKKPKKPSKKK